MNSSFYIHLDILLKKSLANLIVQEQLHIVSIEYSVLREKKQPTLLHVDILMCAAEQIKTEEEEIQQLVDENRG